MRIPKSCFRKPRREWPADVPDAPEELIDLVAAAMVDFGPDQHSDGADVIAALVFQWMRENGPIIPDAEA